MPIFTWKSSGLHFWQNPRPPRGATPCPPVLHTNPLDDHMQGRPALCKCHRIHRHPHLRVFFLNWIAEFDPTPLTVKRPKKSATFSGEWQHLTQISDYLTKKRQLRETSHQTALTNPNKMTFEEMGIAGIDRSSGCFPSNLEGQLQWTSNVKFLRHMAMFFWIVHWNCLIPMYLIQCFPRAFPF